MDGQRPAHDVARHNLATTYQGRRLRAE
jgi:hypothetical protein